MNLTKTSQYMSLILRHKPETIGITLDEHGWTEVDKLIDGISKTHLFNVEMLEEIVNTDDKKRYSFNEDKTLIRANQGHSVLVDVQLKQVIPPKYLWHGTAQKYVQLIDAQGLISKSRLYVHLSEDKKTALKVGQRHGNAVLYRVSSEDMQNDGFEFFISENNVWLTKFVPKEYLYKSIELDC